jgi:Clr5 domain
MPTPEQWDAIREVFTKLYMDEKLHLREVKRKMEEQYGFFATSATLCVLSIWTTDHN